MPEGITVRKADSGVAWVFMVLGVDMVAAATYTDVQAYKSSESEQEGGTETSMHSRTCLEVGCYVLVSRPGVLDPA